jgi:uncharacterized protein
MEAAAATPNPDIPYLQVVVKVSKRCNLRCRYCYEFPFLSDRAAMSLEQIGVLIHRLGEAVEGTGRALDFVWHGGEPLLLPTSFFRQVWAAQQRILEPLGVTFSNSVQTNATVLDDERIALLREMFVEVGVSVDLLGGQRVNQAGRDSTQRVVAQMQRLADAGVNFGCITVLSQSTAPHVKEIYDFFEDIDVSFRLLPIYRSGFTGQLAEHELSPEQIVDALCIVVNRWFRSESFIRVEPVHGYVANVVHALSSNNTNQRFYDRERGEVILIVDTDGSVYSNADAYDQRFRHGNIFQQSIADMRASRGFLNGLEASRQRVQDWCSECQFHGSCTGFFAGEATPEQHWPVDSGRLACGVARPMHEYIETKLVRLGLTDTRRRLDTIELSRRALA